jgi:uncharacterized membrane protein YkvI
MSGIQESESILERRPSLVEMATDALRYWEPRRILYNLVLAAVTFTEAAVNWKTARSALNITMVLTLFVLAVIANLLYCGAYVADIFVQSSALRAAWRQKRWILLVVGLCFAAVLAHFASSSLLTVGE